MNNLIAQKGYFHSYAILLLTLAFVFCFVIIFRTNPIEPFTSIVAYVEFQKMYSQTFKHIAQSLVILNSICLLVIIYIIHFLADDDSRFFSGLSLQFATMSTVCVSIGYFIQFTAVRHSISKTSLEGIEHFLQFYPNSAIVSIMMLGYTLFMGLASYNILASLDDLAYTHLFKLGFTINTVSCFLGLVGYIFEIIPLILVSTNLGNGLGFLLIGMGGIKYFKKIKGR